MFWPRSVVARLLLFGSDDVQDPRLVVAPRVLHRAHGACRCSHRRSRSREESLAHNAGEAREQCPEVGRPLLGVARLGVENNVQA